MSEGVPAAGLAAARAGMFDNTNVRTDGATGAGGQLADAAICGRRRRLPRAAKDATARLQAAPERRFTWVRSHRDNCSTSRGNTGRIDRNRARPLARGMATRCQVSLMPPLLSTRKRRSRLPTSSFKNPTWSATIALSITSQRARFRLFEERASPLSLAALSAPAMAA
jgi:hypothetical protein